jgi:hypothetical protein
MKRRPKADRSGGLVEEPAQVAVKVSPRPQRQGLATESR